MNQYSPIKFIDLSEFYPTLRRVAHYALNHQKSIDDDLWRACKKRYFSIHTIEQVRSTFGSLLQAYRLLDEEDGTEFHKLIEGQAVLERNKKGRPVDRIIGPSQRTLTDSTDGKSKKPRIWGFWNVDNILPHIREFCKVRKAAGQTTHARDYESYAVGRNVPSLTIIYKKVGPWRHAVELSNLQPILENIKEFSNYCKNNNIKETRFNYIKWSKENESPSIDSIKKIVKSWNKVREIALGEARNNKSSPWTRDNVLEKLYKFAEICIVDNQSFKVSDYKKFPCQKFGFPSHRVVYMVYGTWTEMYCAVVREASKRGDIAVLEFLASNQPRLERERTSSLLSGVGLATPGYALRRRSDPLL